MKRFISILLSLIMVLSMTTSMISATSYTDEKEINYTEAVDVMSAIGILSGYDSGEFGPKGNLTRAAAAKIITYLMMGNEAAEKLAVSVAPYPDVPVNHWASGYIAYLTNEGIVSGYSDGNFNPSNKVTTVQFAKMLLGALGYDAEIEKLIGSNWAISTSLLAYHNDLFKNNESVQLNSFLTREEAALYAFNALSANTVSYTSKGTEIIIGNTSIITGASSAVASDKTLAEELYGSDFKKTLVSCDKYGNPANQWSYNGKVIGTYSDEPIATFTTAFNANELIDAIESAGYAFDTTVNGNSDTTVTIIKNGTNETVMAPNAVKNWLTTNAKTDFNWSANGVKVNIFANNDGFINTIVITESILDTVETKIEDNLSTKTVDERAIYTENFVLYAEDEIDGFDELFNAVEEDDAIIVIAKDNEVLRAYMPTVVHGNVTYLKNGSSITVNGINYLNSKNANITANAGDKDIIAYIDEYGYIMGTENGTVQTKAAVILNLYSGLNYDGEIVPMALVLYSNGNTDRVEVGTGDNITEGNLYIYNENTTTGKIDFYPVVNRDTIEENEVYNAQGQVIRETAKAITIGSSKVYFSGGCKFIYVSQNDGEWEYAISNRIQDIDASTPVYAVINQYGNISALYVIGVQAKNTIRDSSALIFVTETDGIVSKVDANGKVVNLTQYVAFIDGVQIDNFVSKDIVNQGFYENEYDNKNNWYVLAGNQYNDSKEDIKIISAGTLTKETIFFDTYISVNDIDMEITSDTVYASTIEDIKINSLAELKAELNNQNTATVSIIYDDETSEALYVYITAIN